MFRILSLDGGGIKGAFSAALEPDTGKAAADYFDLIVGFSARIARAHLIQNSQDMMRYNANCQLHGVTH